MLTTDDRRAREALIATHAQFRDDPASWAKGSYERKRRHILSTTYARCAMGEIAHQLGLNMTGTGVVVNNFTEEGALYTSVHAWLATRVHVFGHTRMQDYNDTATLEQILGFLEQRITELETEIRLDANPTLPVPASKRSLVMSLLSVFI